jgi:hypothetical protein
MTEEEYWATDPSFSDESLHALADAGDYLLGLLSSGTRLNLQHKSKCCVEDFIANAIATLTGMSVDEFQAEAKKWLATAKHPRWDRPYTELTYQPDAGSAAISP